MKVRELVTEADREAKSWNPWESEESEGEDVVTDSETDEMPPKTQVPWDPDRKESKSTATTPVNRAAPKSGHVHDEKSFSH